MSHKNGTELCGHHAGLEVGDEAAKHGGEDSGRHFRGVLGKEEDSRQGAAAALSKMADGSAGPPCCPTEAPQAEARG